MVKISPEWTRDFKELPKEEMEAKLVEQAFLLRRLYNIVDKMETSNYKDNVRKSNYSSPAWPQLQADGIGYARACSEIKNLLKFSKEV